MKKLVSIVLVTAMIASLVSCGTKEKSTSKEGAKGKQLSVEIGPNPETIDPALNSAVDGGNMILHNFECLLVVDQDGNIAPGQAETWECSEDGLTWTFHLRNGLKWSDGTDLTANDFVYSWKRVCDPETAAPYAETVLGMVEGFDDVEEGNPDALNVTAPDDSTFVVKLKSPCPYFESLAAFATLSPVQKATIEKNGDAWSVEPETYISNGAFYVSEWVPNSYIIMTKNVNYWNADAIKLGSIKWNLIEDSNAAYSAYQNGEVLMIKEVPTEEIPSLKNNSEFHIDPIIGTYFISLNTNNEVLSNVKVREALSKAIDREYVANTLMQGTYTACQNFVGPGWKDTDGSSFVDNANAGKAYMSSTADIEGAKAILAEAGYPNGEGLPVLHYMTNDSAYHKVVAEYLQQAWKELGITLEVSIVEWATFTPTRRSGDFEIARNGWVGDYSDPSNLLEIFESGNGNNDGKYSSPEFDAAIEASRTTMDIASRSQELHKAEDIMMEDYACIPLAYYNDFWLQSPKVTGVTHSAYGYWYFMYADITE